MSIFNDWLIPTFVFGILAIVIIFFNLANAFLNGAKILRFFIVLEMIIALIMSGYLIFIIPTNHFKKLYLQLWRLFMAEYDFGRCGVDNKANAEDDTKKDVQRNTPYLRKASGPIDSSLKIEVYPMETII